MKFFTRLVIFLLVMMVLWGCAYDLRKKEIFDQQVGTYVFDINRTELGAYGKDSNVYRKLTITFKEDSTFSMNMQVPFFRDSFGTWIASDGLPYSYNELFFHNEEYKNLEGTHFFPQYLNGSDTIFLINGVNPRQNAKHIQEIYFSKVK